MSGLRAAAAALIEDAPEAMVLDIVRLLINSLAVRSPPTTSRPEPGNSDPEWDALRRQVKEVMRARGLDWPALAQAVGGSATALKIAVSSRRPPRPAMQSRLHAWLAQRSPEAPAVAAAIPFRGARGNGASSHAAA